MGNFANTVDSGTKWYSSHLPSFHRCGSDVTFGRAYPCYSDFVLPGDTFRINYDMLIRLMPLKAPLLNNINARLRFAFVPLRLIDSNTEFIITGSKDGHNQADFADNVPEFKDIWTAWKDAITSAGGTVTSTSKPKVEKHSLAEWLFGFHTGEYIYSNVAGNESAPAEYWLKGYCRFWYDFYRDENLDSYVDFDTFYNYVLLHLFTFGNYIAIKPLPVYRKKDYFVSSLPWQLKGIAPTISLINPYTSFRNVQLAGEHSSAVKPIGFRNDAFDANLYVMNNNTPEQFSQIKTNIAQSMTGNLISDLTVDKIREGFAETRIMERLARCGSRYTEYLMSNFGTAPADGTLQRAQYLGGGKMPILVSEVLQTAQDVPSDTPVGTMRGHGITRGGNRLNKCFFNEFGMIFGFIDIMPQTIYTDGIPRRMTYKNRWDFVNPSFMHLSEQLVRKGELFYSGTTSSNDSAFGYTGIYNELRKSETHFIGNLRDNLSYWSQAIVYTQAPSLNLDFIKLKSSDYLRPFFVTDEDIGLPMVLDINIYNDAYRPLIKDATPGLIDHD